MKQKLTDKELKNLKFFSSKEKIKQYSALKAELWPQEKRAIEKYFIKDGGSVLDIECGTGRTTYPLHKLGFDLIGIDISETVIEEAKAKFPDIDFEVSNVGCTPTTIIGIFKYLKNILSHILIMGTKRVKDDKKQMRIDFV